MTHVMLLYWTPWLTAMLTIIALLLFAGHVNMIVEERNRAILIRMCWKTIL